MEDLTIEFCTCFENVDNESKSKAEKQLNKCISKGNDNLKRQLKEKIGSTEDYVEFVKLMASTCKPFLEFTTKYYYSKKELSDKEYTENLESLINYFRQSSEYGKLPKSVDIGIAEVGLRYNKLLQKTYTDSVYRTGFHVINPTDSLIIFDTKEKSIELEMDCLTKHDLSLRLSEMVRYAVKPDSIGKLMYNFGSSYERTFVIPEIRLATRKVIQTLSSNQLYNLRDTELTNRIIDGIKTQTQLTDFFNIRFLKITNIDFPHLISQVQEAGLMDTYELLQSQDEEKRLEAIKELFNDNSRTAYLIILDHWRSEVDENIQNFILDRLSGG